MNRKLPVRVITVKVEGAVMSESFKVIDWNNSSDRKWLTNHQHWALSNNHKVGLERA